MPKRLLLFALLLALAAVVFWPRGSSGPRAPQPPRGEAAPGPRPPAQAATEDGPGGPPVGVPTRRNAPPPIWRLVVFVTDPSGRAAEGAVVTFQPRSPEFNAAWGLPGPLAAETSAGRVELAIAGEGGFVVLSADASSWAVVRDLGPPPGGVRKVSVRLTEGRPIAGSIVPTSGPPPSEAAVRADIVFPDWFGSVHAMVEAGPNGRFAFRALPPGQYALRAAASFDNRLRSPPEAVVVDTGTLDAVVPLVRFATLVVTIEETGEDRPERGPADVIVLGADNRRCGEELGGDGTRSPRFEVRAGESYRVEVTCAGWRQEGTGEVAIAPDAGVVRVTIPIRSEGEPDSVLELNVHDERGEPVRPVAIGVRQGHYPKRTTTRERTAEGYVLRLLPGRWYVTVETAPEDDAGGPWLAQTFGVDLAPGERLVSEVALLRAGRATFTCEWPEDAEIAVIDGPESAEPPGDERYRLGPDRPRLLAPGHYVVELRRFGERPVHREFDVRAGETTAVSFE